MNAQRVRTAYLRVPECGRPSDPVLGDERGRWIPSRDPRVPGLPSFKFPSRAGPCLSLHRTQTQTQTQAADAPGRQRARRAVGRRAGVLPPRPGVRARPTSRKRGRHTRTCVPAGPPPVLFVRGGDGDGDGEGGVPTQRARFLDSKVRADADPLPGHGGARPELNGSHCGHAFIGPSGTQAPAEGEKARADRGPGGGEASAAVLRRAR